MIHKIEEEFIYSCEDVLHIVSSIAEYSASMLLPTLEIPILEEVLLTTTTLRTRNRQMSKISKNKGYV